MWFIRINEEAQIPSFAGGNAIAKKVEDYYCDDKVNATVAIGKLYKKKEFIDVKYPKGKLHEDELTTYKLLFQHEKLAYIREPLYYYFQNSNSIMHNEWSPANLAQVDGSYEQLSFFNENGFEKAAARAARSYLAALGLNLEKARIVDGQDYPSILKQTLRKELAQYGKTAGVDFLHDNWLYSLAYPLSTFLFRRAIHFLGNIWHLKNN